MCGQLLLVLLQYFLHFAWTIWYQAWLFWSKLFSWIFEDCREAHSRKNTLYPHWALSLCYLSLQQPKPVMGETVGCFHRCYSRNTNIAVWLFPWPWNTSTEALHTPFSSNKADYNIPNWLSSSGVFTTTGGSAHGHSSPAFLNSW